MESFVADRIHVDAPCERVYAAALSPEDILVWLDALAVEVEAREGGRFRAERQDGVILSGVFGGLDPPHRIDLEEVSWVGAGERRGGMTLSFEVAPSGAGTWLTVRHSGLDGSPGWKEFALGLRRHWVRSTCALKRHVEQI